MDAKTVALDILNWYCDEVKFVYGLYKARTNEGEEYKYDNEEEVFRDWYMTLNEDADTDWSAEMEFIENYIRI